MAQSFSAAHTPEVKRLRDAITGIDAISQGGFTDIATVAQMALLWLESPNKATHMDVVIQALKLIWCRAEDAEDDINRVAEDVGCNFRANPVDSSKAHEGAKHV